VARVWLKPGSGKITINDRDSPVYFARPVLRMMINQPFGVTNRVGQYDIVCTVNGGGLSGQAARSATASARRSPITSLPSGRR